VKSLKQLWEVVAKELGSLCHVSTIRDIKTVANRLEHEGLSFLTITLPDFGKDFEKSLDRGRIADDQFPGFSRGGGLPRFLGGFLQLVFDSKTGFLLDVPCKDSIFAIRQLTLMMGKISLPCSDARVERALLKYVECEQEVRKGDRTLDRDLFEQFGQVALVLFGDVFADVDLAAYSGELVPRHGPGATADRLRGNSKFDQREWTDRLEKYFPYGEYSIPNWRFSYLLDPVNFLEPGAERPVKVITAPKTLKTPRIIAVEPTCMQYAQQALMERLVRNLEVDHLVAPMIGFGDQLPNRRMAELGSIDGSLATLDLSEASDRVSNQHVRQLVRHFPHLSGALDACRSRKADVPGHGVLRLAKFASMGSAVCFPVEAMVFLTIVVMGIMRHRNLRSARAIKSLKGQVRVYGDDIVIPTDCVDSVIEYLEAFSLKVNLDKSLWTGKFRESCGAEFYDGRDVSITRVRQEFPTSLKDATKVIATVSLRNRLYEAGLWESAFWIDSWMEPLLGGNYPYVDPDSPVLGRVSFLGYDTQRISPNTHSPQVKGYVVHSTPRASKVSGEGALLKWFLKRGDEPFADRDHLVRSGRPKSVDIRLRWARAV
jgi:phage FluMu protein gp41